MARTGDDVHIVISADAADALKELGEVISSLGDTQKAAKGLKGVLKNSATPHLIDPRAGRELREQLENSINGALDQLQNQARDKAGRAASDAVSAFADGFSRLAGVMDDAGKVLENGFGKALKGITAMATAVSGALAAVTRNSLSIGGGFEAQMTNVKVISGATAEELEELTRKAREMGEALPFTARDAANAMEILAQRGTSARDILASVTDIAALAISQNISMASAAEIVGAAMTNFGLAVDDISQITDVFNNASNQSALTMRKLMEGLKYVGPAAATAGMGLKEAVAAMEVLANAGFSGSMIGTGLSMTLSQLAKKSEVLGVKTKNLDGTLRPLREIFEELQKRGMNLGEATTVFSERAARSAVNLAKYAQSLGQNEQKLQQWGSTQAAVDEKMKTWPNTWSAFTSAVEETHIEIFDQIKEQSKEAMNGVTSLTRTFSKWIGETQIASRSLSSFISGLGFEIPDGSTFRRILDSFDVTAFVERVKGFGSTIRGIGDAIFGLYNSLKTPLGFLVKNLDTFGKISFWGWIIGKGLQVPMAIVNIATAFKTLYGALKLLSAINLTSILAFLTTPFGWAAAGAAAVGAGAYYAYSKYTEAQEAEEEVQRLQQSIEEANEKAIIDVQIKMETGFEELPKSYAKASKEVRDRIDEDIQVIRQAFKEKLLKAVSVVNERIGEIGDVGNVGEKFEAVAEGISDTLAKNISDALEGSKEAFDELPEYWKKVTERLVELGEGAGFAVSNIEEIISAYNAAQDKANETSMAIQETEVSLFASELNHQIDNILSVLPGKIERAAGFLRGMGTGLDAEIIVSLQLDAAREELNKFIKDIAGRYAIPKSAVETGLVNRLQELAAQNNLMAQSLADGWKGAKDGISVFLDQAKDAVNYLGASPSRFLPALNKLTANIRKIDPVTGKVTEAFKRGYEALKEWSSLTFDKLSQRIQKLRKAVEGGFLSEKALQGEFQKLSKELKVQVVAELAPTRGQYKDQNTFASVVASEYMGRMKELGGEAMMKKVREEFSRASLWSGSAIGKSILGSVEREAGKFNLAVRTEQVTDKDLDSLPKFILNGRDVLDKTMDTLERFGSNLEDLAPIVAKMTGESAKIPKEDNTGGSIVINGKELLGQDALGPLNENLAPVISRLGETIDTAADIAQKNQGTAQPQQNIISESLETALGSLQGIISENTSALREFFAPVQDSMSSLEDTILAFEDAMLSVEDSLLPALAGLRERTAGPALDISAFSPASGVQDLAFAVVSARDSIEANNAALKEISGTVGQIRDALENGQGNQQTQDMAQMMTGILSQIVSRLEQTQVGQGTQDSDEPQFQSLEAALNSLQGVISENISALQGVLAPARDSLSSLENTITTFEDAILSAKDILLNELKGQAERTAVDIASASPAPSMQDLAAVIVSAKGAVEANSTVMGEVNDALGVLRDTLGQSGGQGQNQDMAQMMMGVLSQIVSRLEQTRTVQETQNDDAPQFQSLEAALSSLQGVISENTSALQGFFVPLQDSMSVFGDMLLAFEDTMLADLTEQMNRLTADIASASPAPSMQDLAAVVVSAKGAVEANSTAMGEVNDALAFLKNTSGQGQQRQEEVQEPDIGQIITTALTPIIDRLADRLETGNAASLLVLQNLTTSAAAIQEILSSDVTILEEILSWAGTSGAGIQQAAAAIDTAVAILNSQQPDDTVKDALDLLLKSIPDQRALAGEETQVGRNIYDISAISMPVIQESTALLAAARDFLESNRALAEAQRAAAEASQASIEANSAALNDIRGTLALLKDTLGQSAQPPSVQSQPVLNGQDIAQSVITALSPLIDRLSDRAATGDTVSPADIQALSSSITTVQGAVTANTTALGSIRSGLGTTDTAIQQAVAAIEAAVTALNTQQPGNTFNVEIHQHQFVVDSRDRANDTANAVVEAFRTGIGNAM